MVTIDAQRAFEIIAMNKNGEKPLKLQREGDEEPKAQVKEFGDIVGQDSLTRFDNKKKKKRKGGNREHHNEGQHNAQGRPEGTRNNHNNGDQRRKNNRNRNGERKERNNEEKPNN